MLIDTHTHLYSNKFKHDQAQMVERARNAGVKLALLPAIDRESHQAMLNFEAAYPDFCHAMIGVHPVSIKADFEDELALVEKELKRRPWIAIGEIGMDLYWDKTYRAQQEIAFLRQCEWALAYDLPIVIHARESIDELIRLLQGIRQPGLRGVFHCFGGTLRQAEAILDLGFYLGIGGVVTYKNGGLDQVLPYIDKTRILLETDAPYLAPIPYRGKRNETAYIALVAEKVAELWKISLAETADITRQNAMQLFDIEQFVAKAGASVLGGAEQVTDK